MQDKNEQRPMDHLREELEAQWGRPYQLEKEIVQGHQEKFRAWIIDVLGTLPTALAQRQNDASPEAAGTCTWQERIYLLLHKGTVLPLQERMHLWQKVLQQYASLQPSQKTYSEERHAGFMRDMLEELMKEGNVQQYKAAAMLATQLFEQHLFANEGNIFANAFANIFTREEEQEDHARQTARRDAAFHYKQSLTERYGIPPFLTERWEHDTWGMRANVEPLLFIEKKKPGIIKNLIEKFGVRTPALYGESLILLATKGEWLLDWHKNPKGLLRLWEENGNPAREIVRICQLKGVNTDIPRTLHNDPTMGITYFARYECTTLVKLYEQRMENDKRFVLLMFPYADQGPNNGHAFSAMSDIVEGLQRQLEGQGLFLRVMEVGSPQQAVRRLAALQNRFASRRIPPHERHMSAGTFIGGHGMRDSIRLGSLEGLWKNMVRQGEFEKIVHRYSEPGSEIALISCHTGRQGGIAEAMHVRTGRKTIGPSDEASIRSLEAAAGHNGHVHLEVDYGGASPVKYRS